MDIRMDIVNVVATTHLQRELDLDLLSIVLRDVGEVIYDAARFPGLVLKLENGVSYLVFRTGKIVIVGCRSEEHVNEAVRFLVKQIGKVVGGLPAKLAVQIQNIVITADLGYEIDLETLSEKLKHSVYVPDEFPGLIYRSGIGPSALVFSSGRIVVAGAMSIEAARVVVEEIHRLASGESSGGIWGGEDEDMV
ncbi:MAG: TATA-box-binding protein [Ignisphaera sp.]